jgi:hypothetical protein
MVEATVFVGIGLGTGVVLSLLLKPALRWRDRPMNQWQETLWTAYVGAILFGGILFSRGLRRLPLVGDAITNNASLFVIVWLVPIYIVIGGAWLRNKRKQSSGSSFPTRDDERPGS